MLFMMLKMTIDQEGQGGRGSLGVGGSDAVKPNGQHNGGLSGVC